ncbi:TonB-dependent siderophore receptor [Leptolyngbya sp. KIOST-1]|uniref:TonB-dependent siderophore receptor n=1 Tax=Leptolyngbya sp. KIOST-1 TaxID=1229172 RepID=UPI000A93E78F|nr:TonB-dependent siderophore receptor [Leptolyngbya sp. KIOST-1]
MGKMWMMWLGRSAWVAMGLGLWTGSAAMAQDTAALEAGIAPGQALPLSEVERPATTVADWLAQTPVVQITGVQIDERDGTLELTLQATGELARPTTAIAGNALIADIPNVVLALPEGGEFTATAPIPGIALVTLSPLGDNQVRVAITGTDAPPVAQVSVGAASLIFSARPGDPAAGAPTDDTIQIAVTGEQADSGYVVPNASTATRTDTPLLEVPQAIQVIPRQVLEDQQITRVDDALRNVSSVSGRLGPFGNSTNLTIRGFTSDSFTAGPILRDGYRVNNNLGSQDIANVERIEVIKGPSSVLFGQADPGGLVNLVTVRPLANPAYGFGLQLGSYGFVRPTLDLTGPITADAALRYRLTAAYQREDGFRDFNTDANRFFLAPVLSWEIGEGTSLTVLMEYTDEEVPFDLGLPAFGTAIANVPRSRILGEPDDFLRNRALNIGYDLTHQFNDSWTLNQGFRYVGQDYNVLTALPFVVNETTGDITRFFADRAYHSDDYTLQANVVGEFTTGSVEHRLLAGADLNLNRFDERYTRLNLANPLPLNIFNPVYGAPRPNFESLPPLPPFDTEHDRIGVFLQDQISFTDNLILVASLRYDSVNFRNLNDATSSRSDQAWSPRLGLVYQPADTVSLYANYSQSFTPNSGQTASGVPLDTQTARGFEVGAKAEFLDGNLFATLAYYNITKRNVATTDPNNPFFTIAAGEQRSQGIELDIAGEILPGWNVIASYAYTDARVTQDNTIPVGNRLFNTPIHSASLWTTYQIQSGNLQGLGVGLGVNYVGDRYGDLANSFTVGDYFLTNAALFYERDDWRMGLNINNLFDVNYISSTNNSRNFGNAPGSPLSIVGSVSVSF